MSLQDEDGNGAVKVERAACSYKNLSHKFKIRQKTGFQGPIFTHIFYKAAKNAEVVARLSKPKVG